VGTLNAQRSTYQLSVALGGSSGLGRDSRQMIGTKVFNEEQSRNPETPIRSVKDEE
jgi:hypothetical protein